MKKTKNNYITTFIISVIVAFIISGTYTHYKFNQFKGFINTFQSENSDNNFIFELKSELQTECIAKKIIYERMFPFSEEELRNKCDNEKCWTQEDCNNNFGKFGEECHNPHDCSNTCMNHRYEIFNLTAIIQNQTICIKERYVRNLK